MARVTGTQIPIEKTKRFAALVEAYVAANPLLTSFYTHPVNKKGFASAIAERANFSSANRAVLYQTLQQQYAGLSNIAIVNKNIQALQLPNTFTITTAHQPNLFTGPLYSLYKIIHAIKLADWCAQEWPQHRFVPVFYIGSEDADLAELNHLFINGQRIAWDTTQTGAVGRMNTEGVEHAIQQLASAIGFQPFGKEVIELISHCYRKGQSIAQATQELLHELFGRLGLVVLQPDEAKLKQLFIPVMEKELTTSFSFPIVEKTIAQLDSLGFKGQAGGRDINLFYLTNNKRERIERLPSGEYALVESNARLSQSDLITLLYQHPERFSPNVILRGAYQETILPNIAFIGGGSEIAYWLELQDVFKDIKVPFPVLVLRNSYQIQYYLQQKKWERLGLTAEDLFKTEQELLNEMAHRQSADKLSLDKDLELLQQAYLQLKEKARFWDITLAQHVSALQQQAVKRANQLHNKMLRAARRKLAEQGRQIAAVQNELLPQGGLQERKENLFAWYARYGSAFIDDIYQHAPTIEQQFTILTFCSA